jgi:hypothetical protein
MQISAATHSLCFSHAGAFVLPAEAFCDGHMSADWSRCLADEGRITPSQLGCLQAAFALYWERSTALFAAAPASWFPPRRTNLVVVSDASCVMPYFDPFGGTSSLLYLSDLDTHAEYVAYLLVHNERVGLLRSLRAALICNLSYWLAQDSGCRTEFSRAAQEARRPDAAVFVHLAQAFEWIDALGHQPLRVPAQGSTEDYLHVAAADLFIPTRLHAPLTGLCDAAEAALRKAMRVAPRPRTAGAAQALNALCDWMLHTRAHLIVKSAAGKVVWAPGARDASAVRRALRDANHDAVASLHADFSVVHERSRTFLDALHDPASLPRHSAVLVDGDGAYLDASQQAVVYELRQPGFDATQLPAPPIHRMLLGARVMHEWGHLAHAGKLLRVPEWRRDEYTASRQRLGEQFLTVLEHLPQRLHEEVFGELAALAPQASQRAAALARKTLARVGDYLANLLCSRLLPAPEMQAYVRNNVRNHLSENLGPVNELARYAYEIHYLALANMPRAYFFNTSRFTEYFVQSGLVSESDIHALFDATGRVLACYEVDESRLTLPACRPAAGGDTDQNRAAQPSKRWSPHCATSFAP